MASMTKVVACNFEDGFVITDDGRRLPIINWFDEDNAPTTEWCCAVTFLSGFGNEWYAGRVRDWIPVTVH